MSEAKFKEGDWVKQKTGTQGMTVVSYNPGEDNSGQSGKVHCRYKNEEGDEVEGDFTEEDLVPL